MLSCVETCRTFDVYRNREKRKLELVSRIRKAVTALLTALRSTVRELLLEAA